MVQKQMMVDYRSENGTFIRREVDDMEFCVRDGVMYFKSEDRQYDIPLDQCVQVYTN